MISLGEGREPSWVEVVVVTVFNGLDVDRSLESTDHTAGAY